MSRGCGALTLALLGGVVGFSGPVQAGDGSDQIINDGFSEDSAAALGAAAGTILGGVTCGPAASACGAAGGAAGSIAGPAAVRASRQVGDFLADRQMEDWRETYIGDPYSSLSEPDGVFQQDDSIEEVLEAWDEAERPE